MYFELFQYKLMLFRNLIWYISIPYRFSFDNNSISFRNCILNSILFHGLSIHIWYLISLRKFVDRCMLKSILFYVLSTPSRYYSMCYRHSFDTLLVLNLMPLDCFSIHVWYIIVFQYTFDTFLILNMVDQCMLNLILFNILSIPLRYLVSVKFDDIRLFFYTCSIHS